MLVPVSQFLRHALFSSVVFSPSIPHCPPLQPRLSVRGCPTSLSCDWDPLDPHVFLPAALDSGLCATSVPLTGLGIPHRFPFTWCSSSCSIRRPFFRLTFFPTLARGHLVDYFVLQPWLTAPSICTSARFSGVYGWFMVLFVRYYPPPVHRCLHIRVQAAKLTPPFWSTPTVALSLHAAVILTPHLRPGNAPILAPTWLARYDTPGPHSRTGPALVDSFVLLLVLVLFPWLSLWQFHPRTVFTHR